MGTSTGYVLPTGGNWTKTKHNVTDWVKSDLSDFESIGRVFSSFVDSHGGATQSTQQMAQAIQVGSRFASFISEVTQNGLTQTLNNFNLNQQIGKSASDVLSAIRDYLIESNGLLENEIIQNAFVDFYEEQFLANDSFEGLEHVLKQTDIESMVLKFFGYYIYTKFKTEFNEYMMKKVDIQKTQKHLEDMKDYIFTKLRVLTFHKKLATFDWSGSESQMLSSEIFQSAWAILGVEK